jgi:hypothetical protein
MADNAKKATKSRKPKLTKFPNAEEANKEVPQLATATNELPSAFNLFSPSIAIIRNNLTGFLILLGVAILLSMAGSGPELFHRSSGTINILSAWSGLSGLGVIWAVVTAPGVIILELKGVRKEDITYQEAFNQGLNHVWRLLGLGILMFLMLLGSFIFFVVPFFILLPRIIMAPYFLIDQKMGIRESLKASIDHYASYKGIWGLIGVYALINLAVAVPFLGGIISNILTFLYTPANAIRYEQIRLLSLDKPVVTPIEADINSVGPTKPSEPTKPADSAKS